MYFKWDRAFDRAFMSMVAMCGLSAGLSAYDGTNPGARPSYNKKTEERPANYAFAYPKDLNLCEPYDVYFHAEGLAWQARETGTSFALDTKVETTVGSPATLNKVDGDVEGFSSDDSSWDYNFGTRVGLGFYADHDAWNFDFTWTWLNATNSEKAHAHHANAQLIPSWLLGSDTPEEAHSSTAKAYWQCKMNVLDATLGKGYHVSRRVVFTPYFGLRFAWLDQDLATRYVVAPNVGPSPHFSGENNFFGVGLRSGIDTDWELGSGFKLFANAGSALLAGKFKVCEHLQSPEGLVTDMYNVTLDDHFHMNVPVVDLAVGLDWGTYLYNKQYYLDFRAGYEFQVWFDQLNLRKFSGGFEGLTPNYVNDAVSRGMLSFNGFTFKIQLDI